MRRTRHSKPEVEKALQYAEERGFNVIEIHRKHRWGVLTCGSGCSVSIAGTPRNQGDHAKDLRRVVDRCEHQEEVTK